MSEVKTNKLTGTSTAGSISVVAEGNSTTTNLQQGLQLEIASITLLLQITALETFLKILPIHLVPQIEATLLRVTMGETLRLLI